MLFGNLIVGIIGSKTFFRADKEDENNSLRFLANANSLELTNHIITNDNLNTSLEESQDLCKSNENNTVGIFVKNTIDIGLQRNKWVRFIVNVDILELTNPSITNDDLNTSSNNKTYTKVMRTT